MSGGSPAGAAPATPELDCQTCGACCVGLLVRIEAADERRLSRREQVALTVYDEGAGFVVLRQAKDGACLSLGRDAQGRWACAIYARRPGVCRAFERGSPDCHDARRDRGLEPRLPRTSPSGSEPPERA